jgi:hypothetical protein
MSRKETNKVTPCYIKSKFNCIYLDFLYCLQYDRYRPTQKDYGDVSFNQCKTFVNRNCHHFDEFVNSHTFTDITRVLFQYLRIECMHHFINNIDREIILVYVVHISQSKEDEASRFLSGVPLVVNTFRNC